jgi:hypothetical protein
VVAPAGTWTPDHPAHSPVLYHWTIPAPFLRVQRWTRSCLPVYRRQFAWRAPKS